MDLGEAMQIPVDYLRNVPDDMERSDGNTPKTATLHMRLPST